jgi:cytochrome c oxidase subunit IV
MSIPSKFIDPEVIPVDKAHIAKIWRTAGILALITAFEYLLAFTVGMGTMLITAFILLTLLKAYYIVSEFMHLKHESKALIGSLSIPIIFILWLVLAMIMEANYIEDDILNWWV